MSHRIPVRKQGVLWALTSWVDYSVRHFGYLDQFSDGFLNVCLLAQTVVEVVVWLRVLYGASLMIFIVNVFVALLVLNIGSCIKRLRLRVVSRDEACSCGRWLSVFHSESLSLRLAAPKTALVEAQKLRFANESFFGSFATFLFVVSFDNCPLLFFTRLKTGYSGQVLTTFANSKCSLGLWRVRLFCTGLTAWLIFKTTNSLQIFRTFKVEKLGRSCSLLHLKIVFNLSCNGQIRLDCCEFWVSSCDPNLGLGLFWGGTSSDGIF